MKTGLLVMLSLVSVVVGLGYSVSNKRTADGIYLTAPVEVGSVVATVSASGGVEAVVTVNVSSQLSGQIEAILVDFNAEVTKGQPLARLDQEGFEASVREAEANLAVAQVHVQAMRAAVDSAVNAYETLKAEAEVYAARTAKANAEYDKARRDLERKEALRKKGHISEADLDVTQANSESAQADLQAARAEETVHREKIATSESEMQQTLAEVRSAVAAVPQKEAVLKQAKVELERSVIRSPIDGVVIMREVEPGQTVAASLEAPTLFTIAQDLSRMEVHAKVDEADIGVIQIGQRVSFTVDAFSGQSFNGTVRQVRKAPQIVQNVVIYTVIISTANPDLLLLPGMTALAEIIVRESGETLTIPSAALRFQPSEDIAQRSEIQVATSDSQSADGEKATVWVVDESGQPTPVTVMTDMADGVVTEVVGGPLVAGQRVIVGKAPVEEEPPFLGLRFGF